MLAPLYELLKQEAWHWAREQNEAFQRSKELLLSSQVSIRSWRSEWLVTHPTTESAPCCHMSCRMDQRSLLDSCPTRAWSRIHIDFAGPMDGKMFLVVIDAYSKWIEVCPMTTPSTFTTTQQLRQLFSQFGIPETIVSDNGTQFLSAEFHEFCQVNGIHHIRVSPYHPSSNGLAERAVKVFKLGLKKQTQGTITDKIARFLSSLNSGFKISKADNSLITTSVRRPVHLWRERECLWRTIDQVEKNGWVVR